MFNVFKQSHHKSDVNGGSQFSNYESAIFKLKVDNIVVGTLHYDRGHWEFKYTDEFKNHSEYNRIIGFKDLDKIYRNDILWPFFKIRIPGLKQPVIKEIIEREKIDRTNEVELLMRFGKKCISNPYELELVKNVV